MIIRQKKPTIINTEDVYSCNSYLYILDVYSSRDHSKLESACKESIVLKDGRTKVGYSEGSATW